MPARALPPSLRSRQREWGMLGRAGSERFAALCWRGRHMHPHSAQQSTKFKQASNHPPCPAPCCCRLPACPACRWEWEELQPYVQSLRGPGQTAEALLLKYARASQQRPTDPVTYSLR